jgi:hypothetical protein
LSRSDSEKDGISNLSGSTSDSNFDSFLGHKNLHKDELNYGLIIEEDRDFLKLLFVPPRQNLLLKHSIKTKKVYLRSDRARLTK